MVNSAEWVLTYLDDKPRLRTLLEGEIRTSKTPYYYMADLADLDEQEGNKQQALDLLEKAYRTSQGPATRFQWGAIYANGLLRMSRRMSRASVQPCSMCSVSSTGRIASHARARARLDKLNAALVKWSAATKNAATLKVLAQRWQKVCTALPESDPVREECPKLVAAQSS